MSRTEKTTPWKLRAASDLNHLATPVHDHLGRECDLPGSPATLEVTGCYWKPSVEAVYGHDHVEVIDRFTTAPMRLGESRRTRHESHREEHEIVRAALVGISPDDLDDIL